jgi:hypothetical protein
MFNFLGKPNHFFDGWEKSVEELPAFVPETGSLGEIKLGADIETIKALGKPLEFVKRKKKDYTLHYNDLSFDCEDGFITYIGCKLGGVDAKTAKGCKIEKGLNPDCVIQLLGTPDDQDIEDPNDVILTYTRNEIQIECEFAADQGLVRINCFKE